MPAPREHEQPEHDGRARGHGHLRQADQQQHPVVEPERDAGQPRQRDAEQRDQQPRQAVVLAEGVHALHAGQAQQRRQREQPEPVAANDDRPSTDG